MLLCNGCSKSGTHLLTSLAEAIGYRKIGGTLTYRRFEEGFKSNGLASPEEIFSQDNSYYIHAHVMSDRRSRTLLKNHKHIFIVRNPRNVAISWMRHLNKLNPSKPISADELERLIRGGMFGKSVVQYYWLFAHWINSPVAKIVSYEKLLMQDAQEYKRICKYLQIAEHHYSTIQPRSSSTWTGAPSDWMHSSYWTSSVEAAWRDTGGPELEAYLGYSICEA